MQTAQAKQALLEEYTLTVAEAAALLGETEKGIQRLIYTAKLDAIRVKGSRAYEFRLRPSDVLAQRARALQPEGPASQAAVAAERGEDGWPGVYLDLFLRFDQLGRRAARLERENRRLRDVLAQFQVVVSRAGECTARPPAAGSSRQERPIATDR